MFTKGIALSSTILLAYCCDLQGSSAQENGYSHGRSNAAPLTASAHTLHRVPLHGTHVRAPSPPTIPNATFSRTEHSEQPNTFGLKWRKSSQVEPQRHHDARPPSVNEPGKSLHGPRAAAKVESPNGQSFDPFADEDNPTHSSIRTHSSTLQVATRTPQLERFDRQAVSQATWLGSPTRPQTLLPNNSDPITATRVSNEVKLAAPVRSNQSASANQESAGNVFEQASEANSVLEPPRELTPPSVEGLSSNDSRARQIKIPSLNQPIGANLPPRIAELPRLPASNPQLQDATPGTPNQAPLTLPKQAQRIGTDEENPFPKNQKASEPKAGGSLRERLAEDQKRVESSEEYGSGIDYLSQANFSCEEFRDRIASQTIDQISLDISPPFRPDEFDQRRHEELFTDFLEKQPIRNWSSVNGEPMGAGRLVDLAYEKAVIEKNDGGKQLIPINQLSEGDLAHINTTWGLPRECRIEQVAYQPRQWSPTKFTWTASNLNHNPLYFQSVNLERYGHTRGPLIEPIVQSAHFFGNILILPYKMGVHGPRECQYTLGYYRPGNQAPWIKQPLPISARGALAQAATMTGLFWLIP